MRAERALALGELLGARPAIKGDLVRARKRHDDRDAEGGLRRLEENLTGRREHAHCRIVLWRKRRESDI